jgi:hypothetical protein
MTIRTKQKLRVIVLVSEKLLPEGDLAITARSSATPQD